MRFHNTRTPGLSDPRSSLLAAIVAVALLFATGCVGNGEAATDDTSSGTDDAATAETTGDEQATPEASKTDDAENKQDGDDAEEEAVPVEVVSLGRGRMEAVLRFSANLEAEDHVQVFSQAPAQRQVVELLVEEGFVVTRGQVLLRLQDDEQRSAVTKVRSQLGKAQRDFERQKRLYTDKLISEQMYLDAKYEMQILEISLEEAQRELSYLEVKAPIGGTITERLVNLGDTISINQHLFDIVDFDSLVARIYVPEKNLAQLEPGQTARLSTAALQNAYAGEIDRIAPVVDPKTGTIKVTVAVGRQPGLRPGLYMDVDLVTAVHAEAVRLPKRALVYDSDRIFVYRLTDDSRVERVAVAARLNDRDYVEPDERLAAGDQIVIAGQAGLKNGALVSLPQTQEADASATTGADSVSAEPTL